MEEELSPRRSWEFNVLNTWYELIALAEEFRVQQIQASTDRDKRDAYIAKLTRLWLELLPEVEGRAEFKELVEKYKGFRPFYVDPGQFVEKEGQASKIYELEEVLREVLYRLKIT